MNTSPGYQPTISFEFETIKPNVYRLIVKDGDEVINVLEREDHRGERMAKVGLLPFVYPSQLSFDNKEIDRLLFL